MLPGNSPKTVAGSSASFALLSNPLKSGRLLSCPSCQASLPPWLIRTRQADATCPNCYKNLTIELFPAAFRKWESLDIGGTIVAANEAACYEHASKPAKSVCHQCGRFLCALCEVEISGVIWCPGCLQSPRAATAANTLETQRTNFDSIALALATWPVAGFIYLSFLTSPVVVYVVIRYWRKPLSLVPRTRWRFVVALIIALLEIGLLVALIVALIFAARQRGLAR